MRDVVDSGGAAADFRVRQFHKIEIGNGVQKGARSFANFLAVKKMAGILVGDANWKLLQVCGEAESGEEFGDVASLGGKFACLAVLFLALREEMMVFLERGAAAGGVGDDGVEVFAKKDEEILSREFAGGLASAGVRRESAAAKLPSGTRTSQPLAVRTRRVASLSCEKVMLATQPAKKATRARRGPEAGNVQPRRRKKKSSSIRGRRRSRSARPRSFRTPMLRAMACRPER